MNSSRKASRTGEKEKRYNSQYAFEQFFRINDYEDFEIYHLDMIIDKFVENRQDVYEAWTRLIDQLIVLRERKKNERT